jgi:hypothetical protein
VRPKEFSFAFGDAEQFRLVAGPVSLSEQDTGAGAFIHSQIRAVIIFLAQREAGLAERQLKAQKVWSLIVGKHPVEVEDDRTNHQGTLPGLVPTQQAQDLVRFPGLEYSRAEPVKREG